MKCHAIQIQGRTCRSSHNALIELGHCDEGFALLNRQAGGNDQLKANAVQIFKTKGVTSFKTV